MKYCYDYPRPAVTVDILVWRRKLSVIEILLIKRAFEPFQGLWALPGGFIEEHETLEQAALRELEEETSLKGVVLKQFKAYSEPDRDPRQRTITVLFIGELLNDNLCIIEAADDAADAAWFKTIELPNIAFDHVMLIDQAIGAFV